MSKKLLVLRSSVAVLSILILVGLVLPLNSVEAAHRKIVVFKATTAPGERIGILEKHGCQVIKQLSLVNGVAVNLPTQASERAKEALLREQGVLRVDDDLVIEAYRVINNQVIPKGKSPGKGKPDKPPKDPEPSPPQVLPWGVNRIDAETTWAMSTGSGVKVAIMDTGIDLDHPDLLVTLGVNIINSRKKPDDDNGHGTHVAGIVAALDNDIGVVGVAPGASLYAVKVLDRKGSGWLSDIIEGLQWCIDNNVQIVNMSFGSSSDNQSFYEAIIASSNAGLTLVAAVGNSAGSVCYPAAYSECIAVSAIDNVDNFATFSCFGPEIDFTAPGVGIYSTYKGGEYKTMSGTSMSCPHVAGVEALAQGLTALKGELLYGLSEDQQGQGLIDAELTILGTQAGDNLP